MKCPECQQKIKGDIRLLALHMDLAHHVPRSVVLTILRKMGYDNQIKNWRLDDIPTLTVKKPSTERFRKLLENELKRKGIPIP